MKKIFIKFFLLFVIIINPSYAEEIKEIKIIGNKRIANETILVLGNISAENKFESTTINNTLKNLYDTNFFKDINISFSNSLLTIELVEYPIIEKINVNGIKKKSLVEIILDSMTLKDRMSFIEFEFNKDINLIKNILNF